MRWAIIDDGVSLTVPEIVQNIEIDRFGAVKDRIPAPSLNHATVCFKIIQNYASNLFDAVSIKILDDNTRRANKDALIAAFNWCIENDIRLIHMSIGTTEPHDCEAIRETIGRLMECGIVIVAANSNKGVQTYPAYDNRVIGVECDDILEGNQFVYTPNALTGINFRASSRHQLTADEFNTTSLSNSFAAPLITAQLLILAEHVKELTYNNAINWLQKNAIRADERLLFALPREQERAVVIVILNLDKITTGRLMTELKSLFIRDGYSCILKTSVDFMLPETDVIPTQLTIDYYLSWARRFYLCEVIITALTKNDLSGTGAQADLIITDEICKIPVEIPSDNYAVVKCTGSEGTTRATFDIYKEVLKILTEEEMSVENIDDCISSAVCQGE